MLNRDADKPDIGKVANRAAEIFLAPHPEYDWHEIVNGVCVRLNGTSKKMWAVGPTTWRGFRKITKKGPGSKRVFCEYFDHMEQALQKLMTVRTEEDLHTFENEICSQIKGQLRGVIESHQLESYNKIRKPVDLYIEHLVAMSTQLAPSRNSLVPLLFLPLDSQTLAKAFTPEELQQHRLTPGVSYGDTRLNESAYFSLQRILQRKANECTRSPATVFHRIYFDMLWSNRYERPGGNLFETNPN